MATLEKTLQAVSWSLWPIRGERCKTSLHPSVLYGRIRERCSNVSNHPGRIRSVSPNSMGLLKYKRTLSLSELGSVTALNTKANQWKNSSLASITW
jgi:hypothetical protein